MLWEAYAHSDFYPDATKIANALPVNSQWNEIFFCEHRSGNWPSCSWVRSKQFASACIFIFWRRWDLMFNFFLNASQWLRRNVHLHLILCDIVQYLWVLFVNLNYPSWLEQLSAGYKMAHTNMNVCGVSDKNLVPNECRPSEMRGATTL